MFQTIHGVGSHTLKIQIVKKQHFFFKSRQKVFILKIIKYYYFKRIYIFIRKHCRFFSFNGWGNILLSSAIRLRWENDNERMQGELSDYMRLSQLIRTCTNTK